MKDLDEPFVEVTCPGQNCNQRLVGVRDKEDGSQVHFDCYTCGKFGHLSPDAGTVQFERDELAQFPWWKWGTWQK